jgi:hypothetical protein
MTRKGSCKPKYCFHELPWRKSLLVQQGNQMTLLPTRQLCSPSSLLELISPWEAASCVATQEFHNILRSPEVHYSDQKSLAPVLILGKINPVCTIPFHLRSILILSTHIYILVFLLVILLLAFPPISCMHSFPSPSHHPWLIIPWKSSLCSFLLSPVTCFLTTLFSNTLSLCSSLNVKGRVSHAYRTTGKITVLYTMKYTSVAMQRQLTKQMYISRD